MRYGIISLFMLVCWSFCQANTVSVRLTINQDEKIINRKNLLKIKQFILQKGLRETYCNMYGNNPAYRIKKYSFFLNPDSGQKNINCDLAKSDFNELTIRYLGEGANQYQEISFQNPRFSEITVAWPENNLTALQIREFATKALSEILDEMEKTSVTVKTYKNPEDAIKEITTIPTSRNSGDAINYLAKHPEAFPKLMKMVENQENGWILASSALVQSKDKRMIPFYTDLLKNNYYEKEADGSRKEYGLGTKNGCIEIPFMYGGILASALGDMGDTAAIPVLKEAAKLGDSKVQNCAYVALYKLNAVKIDEIFNAAKSNPRLPDALEEIGCMKIHADPQGAIEIFDRIIKEFSYDTYKAASAHFWKVQCYENLKQYENAIKECDEVLKFEQYTNLVNQIKATRPKLEELATSTK